MSRLHARLAALRRDRRAALVAYLVAGDPTTDATVEFMHAMVEGGADVIELGMPFTDPVADGPAIQAACERALKAGTRLRDVFDCVARFRRRDADTPVVLMGYLNSLEAAGPANFAHQAADAGADGVLVVDLPAEEATEVGATLAQSDLELVCLIAPTTGAERLARICRAVTGFVYYVSLKGVTGAGGIDHATLTEQVARIRACTDRPVGVGFGIGDAVTAARVAREADAIIVGSLLVKEIAARGTAAVPALVAALAEIRRALDTNTAVATTARDST